MRGLFLSGCWRAAGRGSKLSGGGAEDRPPAPPPDRRCPRGGRRIGDAAGSNLSPTPRALRLRRRVTTAQIVRNRVTRRIAGCPGSFLTVGSLGSQEDRVALGRICRQPGISGDLGPEACAAGLVRTAALPHDDVRRALRSLRVETAQWDVQHVTGGGALSIRSACGLPDAVCLARRFWRRSDLSGSVRSPAGVAAQGRWQAVPAPQRWGPVFFPCPCRAFRAVQKERPPALLRCAAPAVRSRAGLRGHRHCNTRQGDTQ